MEKEELLDELEKCKAQLEYYKWKAEYGNIVDFLKLNERILFDWNDRLDSDKIKLYKESRWLELYKQTYSLCRIDDLINNGVQPNDIIKTIKEYSEKVMKEQEVENNDESKQQA